jgi:hypothetical protein
MKIEETILHNFKFTFLKEKKGEMVVNAKFRETFGSMSIDEAFILFAEKEGERLGVLHNRYDKIRAFEKHLLNVGARCVQSGISESRYYFYQGVKYRFSSHVYPTGSMSSDNAIKIVDLAANPELIDSINF